ncbi:putative porin [Leptospira perolatii]|uniref:Porin n=1 Tax=Leptospira perolatii TaxID=2023191 RepID=A0A2M9ZPD7_9LEPT|nr:putative porin [Leptospira perolatii]PJZ70742.1 putative porin [Leptospira perolatii]PJZ73950.1 putative porin [Leptospira perolatii]
MNNYRRLYSGFAWAIFVLLLPGSLFPQGSTNFSEKNPGSVEEKKSYSSGLNSFLSRSSATILFGLNGGEHIFESGTKYPNLSGVKAGSRISYNRDFTYAGLEFKHWLDQWEVQVGYRSTGGYKRVGEGRDEDFALGDPTVERGSKIAFREFAFYDTPYTFTGSRNFADGKGRLSMKQDRISLQIRKYFGSSNPDSRKSGHGIFWAGGIHYTFFKYYLYDVMQWVASDPVFYDRIGLGLSFSNTTWEFPVGIGYRYSNGGWVVDTSFLGLSWYSHFRDYHYHRTLNFIGNAGGYGFEASLGLGYNWSRWLAFLKLTEHRLYGSGSFSTKGGLSNEDLISGSAGRFRNYLNTKQYNIELSMTSYLDWAAGN